MNDVGVEYVDASGFTTQGKRNITLGFGYAALGMDTLLGMILAVTSAGPVYWGSMAAAPVGFASIRKWFEPYLDQLNHSAELTDKYLKEFDYLLIHE